MTVPTIVRSTRPTCPACGFAVFNRRCTTCERCHAELPNSIVYTADEIAALRRQERADETRAATRRSDVRATNARRGLGALVDPGAATPLTVGDVLDAGLDLTGLLDL